MTLGDNNNNDKKKKKKKSNNDNDNANNSNVYNNNCSNDAILYLRIYPPTDPHPASHVSWRSNAPHGLGDPSRRPAPLRGISLRPEL